MTQLERVWAGTLTRRDTTRMTNEGTRDKSENGLHECAQGICAVTILLKVHVLGTILM